ncbi:MAG: hypothetical protein M0R74_12770 [Dehalococcoidia bacterium]|nr:hypothetical protein [Dehalococcoidia bacterium]
MNLIRSNQHLLIAIEIFHVLNRARRPELYLRKETFIEHIQGKPTAIGTVLWKLSQGGLIENQRGRNGGYRKREKAVFLSELFDLFEVQKEPIGHPHVNSFERSMYHQSRTIIL